MRPRAALGSWRSLLLVVVALATLPLVAALNHVSDELTEEDRFYLSTMLHEAGRADITVDAASSASFARQIEIIQALQEVTFLASPTTASIPLFQPREPKDIYLSRKGLCYDRSRVIEKLAQYAGFQVQHVSIYEATESLPGIVAWLIPRRKSHAVSSIRTTRGWMVVDSTSRWIALTQDGRPMSISDIKRLSPSDQVWSARVPDQPNELLTRPFVYVIGLYSRHGLFYPPYLPFPDVNFLQLKSNWDDQ